MLRKLIALALAALMTTATLPNYAFANSKAPAPQYHAFCKGGVPSKDELVRRMRASIDQDHSGKTKLEKCQANPNQFLYAFQQADPDAGLTSIDQLPGYLEGLAPMHPDAAIEYYSSCVKGKSGGVEDVIMQCDPQMVPANVPVYGNPKTGRMTLKLNCANPGLVPVKTHCRYVLISVPDTGRPTVASIGTFGKATPEELAACPISVQGPGSSSGAFDESGYRPLRDEVAAACDWTDTAERIGLPLFQEGCISVAPGWYILRIPDTDNLRPVICLETTDGRLFTAGLGVLPNEYHRLSDTALVATIWPSEKVAKSKFPTTILWWRWGS